MQRRGEDQGPKEAVLAVGDTLLLQGTWKALDKHLDDPDVLVVDSPELVRRQAVPMGQTLGCMKLHTTTSLGPLPFRKVVLLDMSARSRLPLSAAPRISSDAPSE